MNILDDEGVQFRRRDPDGRSLKVGGTCPARALQVEYYYPSDEAAAPSRTKQKSPAFLNAREQRGTRRVLVEARGVEPLAKCLKPT